jgi:hypothetical protein
MKMENFILIIQILEHKLLHVAMDIIGMKNHQVVAGVDGGNNFMTCKTGSVGESGMYLYRVYCHDCDRYHAQYRFPCNNPQCEDGKAWINDGFGYEICKTCNGHKYLKENEDEKNI